jgi:hypothetical protein
MSFEWCSGITPTFLQPYIHTVSFTERIRRERTTVTVPPALTERAIQFLLAALTPIRGRCPSAPVLRITKAVRLYGCITRMSTRYGDVAGGLMGPIIITRRGMARADGSPIDVDREFVVGFMEIDESQSWYLADNIKAHATTPEKVQAMMRPFFLRFLPVLSYTRSNLRVGLPMSSASAECRPNSCRSNCGDLCSHRRGRCRMSKRCIETRRRKS